MSLFDKHSGILFSAIKSVKEGVFFNHFPEFSREQIYKKENISNGYQKFKEFINKKFESLRQAEPVSWEGNEVSPFLQQRLNIEYPTFSADTLISRARNEFHKWRRIKVEDRAGLLIESLERIKEKFFEIAYAHMHTTGMSYTIAFQMAGPQAAQRALIAIAMGYDALQRFPDIINADVYKNEYGIKLEKRWKAVPKGISLILGCATLPSRDAFPGIYASLITGNPVIVKPHPSSILPLAMVVAEIQKVFSENGYDPNICQLAIEGMDSGLAQLLASRPEIKLIDYKDSCESFQEFEKMSDKTLFTEKSSVNPVILDSTYDLDFMIQNLVISLSLYSGQMNNTPQNFFVPEKGILCNNTTISYEKFIEKFTDALNQLTCDPVKGPEIMGVLENPSSISNIENLKNSGNRILYEGHPYQHPEYPNAPTLCPALIEVDHSRKEIYNKEYYGPFGILIKTKNTQHSIDLALETVKKNNSTYCSAFITDIQLKHKIIDEFTVNNIPVTINMIGNIYVERDSAYDHFHLTGGNTASRASSSNLEFLLQRFTWVGFREPVYESL